MLHGQNDEGGNIPSIQIFLSMIINLMSCNLQIVFLKNAVQ